MERVHWDQRELFSRAFALRRALTFARDQQHQSSRQLNGCDGLLLSLILDQEEVRSLRVGEGPLADALCDAFEKAGRLHAPTINGPRNHDHVELELLRFCSSFELADRGTSLLLAYGLPGALPLASDEGAQRLWLTPLAFSFPAAWSSRMAWLASAETREEAAKAQGRLSALLPCDELDPLYLFDELQAKRNLGSDTSLEAQSLAERCIALEERVRELETSGLVRYQTLLSDASRRLRYGP